MEPIKAWWWRPRQKPYGVNLGDEINPQIIGFVAGRAVQHCPLEEAELIGIGSIVGLAAGQLQRHGRSRPLQVWGSGLISPKPLGAAAAPLAVRAVRGPLSRCVLELSATTPLGDPALLAPLVWPPPAQPAHGLGIVLHHSQLHNAALRAALAAIPGSVLIDVTAGDVGASVATLASCERVLSSGLHGLILADAYGIANAWASFGPLHAGGEWKFFDYGLAVERALVEPALRWQPEPQGGVAAAKELAALLPTVRFSLAAAARIAAVQADLIEAFPPLDQAGGS